MTSLQVLGQEAVGLLSSFVACDRVPRTCGNSWRPKPLLPAPSFSSSCNRDRNHPSVSCCASDQTNSQFSASSASPAAFSAYLPASGSSSRPSPPLPHALASADVAEEVLSADGLLLARFEELQYEPGELGAVPEARWQGTGKRPVSEKTREYLTEILDSRVYDVAVVSPLERANKLSAALGNEVFLKREDMQKVFSFKLRGAYNMMAKLSKEQLTRGVITASAGNHAQGVALAAAKLGCTAIIAMPVTTPEIKWRAVNDLGATVALVGDAFDATQAYAKRRAAEEGLVFVPPFDHPDVIAGQGTVGFEILQQHPEPLHAIFVPVGGGGLIAGIAAYIKSIRGDEIRIIGVEPADANAMALSLHKGQRVQLKHAGGFADGVAVKVVGEETFRLSRELVDGVVLVSRDAICAAIKDVFTETRSILEPAGALALAGAKAYCQYYGLKGESVVAITSGANMNFDRLRMVTELANVGAKSEAVLATSMPETPGSFKKFVELVGGMNITEFKYRFRSKKVAHVLYSVGLHREEELQALIGRMQEAGLDTKDMSKNDLAKDHLRHLVHGSTGLANEALFRFVFPERPGALRDFLNMLSPRWNITLFHYRAQGEMGANILVALQVPPEEESEFKSCADALGYSYSDERTNDAYLMFMGPEGDNC
eukprot:TRINITY_DN831_c3_g1_i1.p1 TRINITY_DN831_c3_g1~~TRINITY_DN831_c3_g1_i1.p1  ORF type:complete len:657 (+),score=125.18 TRINITY_DN831_c3_g1_i1:103-2073(+)